MPLHVWDTATDPLAPAWSDPVAEGNAFVRHNNQWRPLVQMYVRDGQDWRLVTGIVPPPPVMPQGSLFVSGGQGTGTITLTVSNRFSTWYVRGTQRVYDNGVLVSSVAVDEQSDVFVQPMLGISTTGEAVWTIEYYEALSELAGPQQSFSIFF
jgi:hypothetical protein